jgi:hypothetical protein
MFHVPNKNRVRSGGRLASTDAMGNNGAFLIPSNLKRRTLVIIASDGRGWEHVSVHAESGKEVLTPLWDEMCHVKETFWDPEDCVMQLHPKKSEYVNNHPHTLHLWRPTDQEIPQPDSILVGDKSAGILHAVPRPK